MTIRVKNLFPLVPPPGGQVIAFVGEAPAAEEVALGEPFVGAAGRELNRWLKAVGIIRSHSFIGNISQVRAPHDKLENMFVDSKCHQPNPELAKWIDALREDLERLKPSVVVALGRHPMWALTGKDGISKQWGSILPCTLVPGLKVIPLYHPSAIIRGQFGLRPIMVTFLRRALEESKIPGLQLPEREYLINPPLEEVLHHLHRLRSSPAFAFDIERPKMKNNGPSYISHISFADSSQWAISIPFLVGKNHRWAENQEAEILKAIAALFRGPALKIAHNLMFDYLCITNDWKMYIAPPFWDTMIAHNVTYPDLSNKALKKLKLNSLAFCTTLYTKEPYYKEDYKSENENSPTWKGSEQEFALYNAKDSVVAYEIHEREKEDLDTFNILQHFQADMDVFEALAFMSFRGILRDQEKLENLRASVEQHILELQATIDAEVGEPLNVSSPQQVANALYTVRGNKVQYNVDGRVTTDEAAMAKLRRISKDPLVPMILNMRRASKFLGTYLNANLSEDGRFRTTYNMGRTVGSRISSSQSILGGGGNLQNIPSRPRPGEEEYNVWIKRLKQTFIADPGKGLGRRDYSQAEAKVVAYMSNDKQLIQDFASGIDIHCRTAEQLFKIPYDDLRNGHLEGHQELKMKRYFGKKCRHAFNYKMSKRRLKEEFWKEGIYLEERECQRMLDALALANPATVRWWRHVEEQLNANRIITNPLGGRRYFMGLITDEVVREAIAEGPQSTVARLLNMAIRDIWKELKDEIDLTLQIHDAIVWQSPIDKMEAHAERIGQLMAIPITIGEHTFTIPSDLAVGPSWGDLK